MVSVGDRLISFKIRYGEKGYGNNILLCTHDVSPQQKQLKEARSSMQSPIDFFELNKLAQTFAEKMEMFLRKDFSVVLIGHSLAGCVAMILAQILQSKKLKVDIFLQLLFHIKLIFFFCR